MSPQLALVAGFGYDVHMSTQIEIPVMQPLKVGIREFRAHLPHYLLETGCPIAVTRHGETIGYFIPSREARTTDNVAALKAAAAKLDELLAAHGISEDELVAEFRRLRAAKSR